MLPGVAHCCAGVLTYGQHSCKTRAVMARTPREDRPAIARWLIETREAHGLTATAFLDALEDAAPNYSTYARWESGKVTPKADSLRTVFDYWEARGVRPFVAVAAEREPSIEERTIRALELQAASAKRQADAMEMHVRLLARQTIATEAIATRQGAKLPTGPAMTAQEDEILALVRSALAHTPSQGREARHLPAGEG